MNNLSEIISTVRVMNAVAAGTTDQNSSSVDMATFKGVRFVVAFGTITSGAVTSIKAQQSADDSNWNDLEGTAQTVADDDDNQVFIIDIRDPTDRYVRVVVDRGTQSAVIDGIIAERYAARGTQPLTNDSTTVGGQEIFSGPAEGTA